MYIYIVYIVYVFAVFRDHHRQQTLRPMSQQKCLLDHDHHVSTATRNQNIQNKYLTHPCH